MEKYRRGGRRLVDVSGLQFDHSRQLKQKIGVQVLPRGGCRPGYCSGRVVRECFSLSGISLDGEATQNREALTMPS